MKSALEKQIIVILGNGFDLHLGLHSSYKNFFESSVLKDGSYYGSNILFLLLYYRYFAKGTYDYGAFRRSDESDPTWMDVEGFLKKIATDKNIFSLIKIAYADVINPHNKSIMSNYSLMVRAALTNAILKRNPPLSGNDSAINRLLLEDLLDFETQFKAYLSAEISSNKDYDLKKSEFFEKIVSSFFKDEIIKTVFLYNFNYTEINGDYYAFNVHGTLKDKIVIGYDSTVDNESNDIYELSKDWQKVGINNDGFDLDGVDTNEIIFYGHSLGEQDYPYFFEIFDRCNLLDNNKRTALLFCYSKHGDKNEQEKELIKYEVAVSKLLNAYESYKQPNVSRNTIVTKLKSRNRLKVVEIKD